MINKRTIFQQTLFDAQNKLSSGSWQPGQRLPTIKALAKDFSVSITTMREVLKTLEDQEKISIEHGRGIYVRNDPLAINGSTIADTQMNEVPLTSLLEARLLIEPELAFRCAQNASTSQIERLKYLSEKMDTEMRTGDDFISIDLDFHNLIAGCAKQPVLEKMVRSLDNIQIESRKQTNTIPNMRTKAAQYHTLIAIAISERNAEDAKLFMKKHIISMLEPLQALKK